MGIVHSHRRRTASGKTTTVRQHTRDVGASGSGGNDPTADHPPGTWYFRNSEDGEIYAAWPDGTTHRVRDAEPERPAPPPVNRVPAYRPQGDHDFADRRASWEDDDEPEPQPWMDSGGDEPEPARDLKLSDSPLPNPARDV